MDRTEEIKYNSCLNALLFRNRVSYVTYTDSPGVSTYYNQGIFYSYDIHGNVDTLLQDYGQSGFAANMMNKNGNRWKKVVYNYDLISGKVNQVQYQPGWADQWFHRYVYDAENRLTAVETSTDRIIWEKEANYEYYLHGPLARTIIGGQQVQGLDYAYTLQGWMKGVNSVALNPDHDMGNDAKIGHLNQYVAKDIFSFNLNYYAGDYFAINRSTAAFPGYMAFLPDSAYRPLYNGNISAMAESIDSAHIGGLYGGTTLFYNYKYDQLNRIKRLDTYRGFNNSTNSFSALSLMDQYKERVNYDANGNILTYLRNADKTGTEVTMDNLTYSYYPGTNQLRRVTDTVKAGTYGVDIDNQPTNNYAYDEIGNMIKDSAEGLAKIEWTVYGKIKQITRNPSAINKVTRITYTYDASGNRISKLTEKQGTALKQHTWYVRDAQGNTMAVYTDSSSVSGLDSLIPKLAEQHIYGTSRLGINTVEKSVDNGPSNVITIDSSVAQRGLRFYELTNHLGNVQVTISDRKNGVPSPTESSLIAYYTADVKSAQSYYPFGMVMPGRGVQGGTGCHEERQDLTEVKATSNLDTLVTVNGNQYIQNGVTWLSMTTTGVVSLSNKAMKHTSGGGSSEALLASVPTSALEVNTTYVFEFDITEKSSDITSFACYGISSGYDPYRTVITQTGTGHVRVMVKTPSMPLTYLRLRVSANSAVSGSYFLVDNFVFRKYKVESEIAEYSSDMNSAVKSGANINDNGQLWTPLLSSYNTLSVDGTTDKKIKVTPTNLNESRLYTEMDLVGGRSYTLRFTLGQDSLNKRVFMTLYYNTGSTWTASVSQSLYVTGTGNNLLNFNWPAEATKIRVEFRRNSSTSTQDGVDNPYTIDNFSISRLDTTGAVSTIICDEPNADDDQKNTLYRYGFNGKENDNEVKGMAKQQDYGMRVYDQRLGKFLSVDPIHRDYADLTPYQFASNTPIQAIDLDGLEKYIVNNYWRNNILVEQTVFIVRSKNDISQIMDLEVQNSKGALTTKDVLVINRNDRNNSITSIRGNNQLSITAQRTLNNATATPIEPVFDEKSQLEKEPLNYQGTDNNGVFPINSFTAPVNRHTQEEITGYAAFSTRNDDGIPLVNSTIPVWLGVANNLNGVPNGTIGFTNFGFPPNLSRSGIARQIRALTNVIRQNLRNNESIEDQISTINATLTLTFPANTPQNVINNASNTARTQLGAFLRGLGVTNTNVNVVTNVGVSAVIGSNNLAVNLSVSTTIRTTIQP